MNRDQKAVVVDEVATQIQESEAVFAVDYRGISVAQAAELRTRLSEAGARFRVVKNTLTELAADRAGADPLKEVLDGPTAFTFVSQRRRRCARRKGARAVSAHHGPARVQGRGDARGGAQRGADRRAVATAQHRDPAWPARRDDRFADHGPGAHAERADRRPGDSASEDRRRGPAAGGRSGRRILPPRPSRRHRPTRPTRRPRSPPRAPRRSPRAKNLLRRPKSPPVTQLTRRPRATPNKGVPSPWPMQQS